MKILMVSMNSIHFRRWTSQLENSGHEVFWFDIKDQGYIPSLDWVHQIIGWKKGFLNKGGRYFIKKWMPPLYRLLSNMFDTAVAKAFAKAVTGIQPDVVHSFVLYMSCAPILEVMKKSKIPWVYSSWGSDLFYFKNIPSYRKDIEAVLPEIDYLFTDCQRDQMLAKKLGFSGVLLGVFPGGGGFDLEKMEHWRLPRNQRHTLLIKGYQGRSGKAIPVLKAIKHLQSCLTDYETVVFGCSNEVIEFGKAQDIKATLLSSMPREDILKLMGKSLIYIGNSNSDGMPNTLLEAVCMGTFPIQSNPGGASAEIIEDGTNGLLIQDCENIQGIQQKIEKALEDKALLQGAFDYNMELRKQLEYKVVRKSVLKQYTLVEREIEAGIDNSI